MTKEIAYMGKRSKENNKISVTIARKHSLSLSFTPPLSVLMQRPFRTRENFSTQLHLNFGTFYMPCQEVTNHGSPQHPL